MNVEVPAGGDVEMGESAEEAGGLAAEVVEQVNQTHAALSATRKKRKAPEGYATVDDVKGYTAKHTIPSLHSPSPSGINSLAVSTANPSQFLTGGNDKIVQLYDRETDKVVQTLKGHSKKVLNVRFREHEGDNTLILSSGADKIAKAWTHDTASGEYKTAGTIRTHKGEVTGLGVHPSSKYLALASADRTWSFHDLNTFQQVFRSPEFEDPFTTLEVHPDGHLLALGTPGGAIQVFDVRSSALAASLVPADVTPFTVNTLSFSENGYHLVAPDSLASVAIWDLRKPKIAKSIALGESFKVNKVAYDYSANFFAVAGNEGLRVIAHKTWEELVRFEEGGEVSDVVFGAQGREIWGVSGREVRIWGSA